MLGGGGGGWVYSEMSYVLTSYAIWDMSIKKTAIYWVAIYKIRKKYKICIVYMENKQESQLQQK